MKAVTLSTIVFSLTLISAPVAADEAEHPGVPAYTLEEHDLFLEGIAGDPATGALYLSSLFKDKIVRITPGADGPVVEDFITSGQHGFMSGVGLSVDSERGLVFALSGLMTAGSTMTNGLFVFTLEGELIHRTVVEDTTSSLWNDIVVASDGTAYFTDSQTSRIYAFSLKNHSLIPWAQCSPYPNGLVLSPDEQFLYVATFQEGIQRIDMETSRAEPALAPGAEADSRGIDGLMIHHDTGTGDTALYGIQNAFRTRSRHAITRYPLNAEGLITGAETLDRNHPAFNVPTTGVVLGDSLYCIANSQLDYLNQEEKQVAAPDSLVAPVILRYDLKAR